MVKIRTHIYSQGIFQEVFFGDEILRNTLKIDMIRCCPILVDGLVEAVTDGSEYNVFTQINWCNKQYLTRIVDNVNLYSKIFDGKFRTFHTNNLDIVL